LLHAAILREQNALPLGVSLQVFQHRLEDHCILKTFAFAFFLERRNISCRTLKEKLSGLRRIRYDLDAVFSDCLLAMRLKAGSHLVYVRLANAHFAWDWPCKALELLFRAAEGRGFGLDRAQPMCLGLVQNGLWEKRLDVPALPHVK
jgi:hypothetical protein